MFYTGERLFKKFSLTKEQYDFLDTNEVEGFFESSGIDIENFHKYLLVKDLHAINVSYVFRFYPTDPTPTLMRMGFIKKHYLDYLFYPELLEQIKSDEDKNKLIEILNTCFARTPREACDKVVNLLREFQ